ncbi:MAG TPA: Fe-S protein assembly chaperone HscA [Polyangia bacterium]|nr:Fe-S protein assembly chaperone HscA [Polyangia bacterium]
MNEPGESQAKEKCETMRVVGIDLGTTHSLVATVVGGIPRCLPVDATGERLLPSVVEYFEKQPLVVGAQALADAAARPKDTIVSVKRFMGRGPSDAEVSRRFTPYEFASQSGPVVRFRVAGGKEVTPIEVSAEILRRLRQRAEEEMGGPVDGAVITVPAYFDDAQRQATKDAGRLAGLEVLRLLNEPTAAALAYGLDKRSEGTYAVYDLGGGTFDISILKLTSGVFEVKSTGGDTALGGDDFDRALAELFLKKLGKSEITGEAQGEGRRLLQLARRLKHELTDEETATTMLDGQAVTVTRAEFEEAIAPVLVRTGGPCRRALKDAGLQPKDLDGVILVGGATRTPAVRRFVRELFGREPLGDIDPDQVVALGAAVQADLLAGAGPREDAPLLLDVTPLSLGLEMMGGVVEKIIPRNSPVPTGVKQTFTTYADNQTGFDLHVLQGERETAAQCRSLGRFLLKGIPPMPAGMARLEVTFLVDADGILHVMAREEVSGKEASIDIKPSYGLTDEEVERMLLDSYEHAEEDVKTRLLVEMRVEAERILQATRAALAQDGARLLNAEERAAIEEALARLDAAEKGTDHHAIRQATEALDHASQEFAQRRMNEQLGRAMAGRSVGDVESRLEK